MTHVCIEYLRLAEDRVCDEDTRRCFPHKPVTSNNIYRRPIERIRVYGGCEDRETREYNETRS